MYNFLKHLALFLCSMVICTTVSSTNVPNSNNVNAVGCKNTVSYCCQKNLNEDASSEEIKNNDSDLKPMAQASINPTVTQSTDAKIANNSSQVTETVSKSNTTPVSSQSVPAAPQTVSQPKADSAPKECTTESADKGNIDLNSISSGVVKVSYNHDSSLKVKIQIQNPNGKYIYNLNSTNGYESFPLQIGSGSYTVTLLKNTSGTSYTSVNSWNFNANVNSRNVYLNSIQLINFNSSMAAIVKAKQIASTCGSNDEKVNAIYKYIVENIKYNGGITSLSSSYIPNIDSTFNNKSGICYDFSSLFAAMLRSVGIPAKLIMGSSSNVNGYHAWNEVYLDSKGGYAIIDTSYDSQMRASGSQYTMIKDCSQYQKSKEY